MASRLPSARCAGALLLSFVALFGAPVPAQTPPSFRHVHAGNVFKAWIAADGSQTWTVEDGGRARHRDSNGTWTFQDVDPGSDVIQDQLLAIHFLEDDLTGWAVSVNGWIARTTSGGQPWNHRYEFSATNPPQELWDIWFTDSNNGWLVGQHTVYRTDSGGDNASEWEEVMLLDKSGNPIAFPQPPDESWFFYGIDVHLASNVANPPSGKNVVGLLCATPGVIFRNIDADGWVWQIAYDLREDLCDTASEPRCMNGWCDNASAPGIPLYDVSISRNEESALALVVGGGDHCGLMLSTTDWGITWTSERHECCVSNINSCPDCNGDSAYDQTAGIHRLKTPEQLYSVAIWDGDNTAIASGYSGQHLLRDSSGVWHDRSVHTTDPIANPQAVITPMYGVAADEGSGMNRNGMISGAGGYLRFTDDGGASWNDEDHPDVAAPTAGPYRLRGTHFIDDDLGFVVGQWYRIAKTTDGGYDWDHIVPQPVIHGRNLLAITFSPTGENGVAVGEAPSGGRPKILYATIAAPVGSQWASPSSVTEASGTISTDRALRCVSWAGATTFWAAGEAGLIYTSSDGGDQWQQFLPPNTPWTSFNGFDIEGVTFRDLDTGIFVGSIGGVGTAFRLDSSSTSPWEDVGPTSSTLNFGRIHAVALDASNDKAYAVATAFDATSGEELGVLLQKSGIAGTSDFAVVGTPQPACTIGDELAMTPILTAIDVAPGGVAWFGGECGRVFSYSGTGSIVEHESQTDAHIRGISFPSTNVGVLSCLRQGRTGWSIVRYE